MFIFRACPNSCKETSPCFHLSTFVAIGQKLAVNPQRGFHLLDFLFREHIGECLCFPLSIPCSMQCFSKFLCAAFCRMDAAIFSQGKACGPLLIYLMPSPRQPFLRVMHSLCNVFPSRSETSAQSLKFRKYVTDEVVQNRWVR